MNKLEFYCSSLPSDLILQVTKSYSISNDLNDLWISEGDLVKLNSRYLNLHLKASIPVIRPLSNLTKECIQNNYNEGKPFIPIVKLAKIAGFEYLEEARTGSIFNTYYHEYYTNGCSCSFAFEDGYFRIYDGIIESTHIPPQLILFKQLLKWHFWIDKPKSEKVVYVTKDFNPYKQLEGIFNTWSE